MNLNVRKHLLIATLGLAGALCLPAAAQYPQDRQYQPQHDQDDQNRDRARGHDDDQNRAADRNGGYYNQNDQWRNTKAYKQGFKDGEHDRDKNRGERADRKHWKNDQDRQAYESGYYAAYRGNGPRDNGHDRDDQRHDH